MYEGVVEFISNAEWNDELDKIYDALPREKPTGDNAEGEFTQPQEGTPTHEAWCKLKSVYGRVAPRRELTTASKPPPQSVKDVAKWYMPFKGTVGKM